MKIFVLEVQVPSVVHVIQSPASVPQPTPHYTNPTYPTSSAGDYYVYIKHKKYMYIYFLKKDFNLQFTKIKHNEHCIFTYEHKYISLAIFLLLQNSSNQNINFNFFRNITTAIIF